MPDPDPVRAPEAPVGAGSRAADESGQPSGQQPPGDQPPGLRNQLGATVGAGRRLVKAHVDLARAEIGEILDEVKRVAALIGAAIGALVLLGLFLPIGTFLFVGEALFGSMGWGILHGALLLIGFAVAMILLALEFRGRSIGIDLAIAIVIGIVVGVVLGLDLTNRGWTELGNQFAANVSSDIRPLAVGAVTLAIVGAVIGLIVGGRVGGMGGAIGGLVAGAIVGALLGALTAVALGPRVGAAIGVTVALVAWPVLMGLRVRRQGVDTEALKARFVRTETIDTTKETIEWVRAQTPLGRKS